MVPGPVVELGVVVGTIVVVGTVVVVAAGVVVGIVGVGVGARVGAASPNANACAYLALILVNFVIPAIFKARGVPVLVVDPSYVVSL